MRQWCLGLFVLPALVTLYACGASQPAASNDASSAAGDSCPVVDPGPPPVCPEGCTWDGETCRKHSGVIVEYLRDAGVPVPSPSPSPSPSSPPSPPPSSP
jgi:hypothetical protein